MNPRRNPTFRRTISDFMRRNVARSMPPHDVERLLAYVLGRWETAAMLPARGRGFDWARIADAAGVDFELLMNARAAVAPALLAAHREIARLQPDPGSPLRAGRVKATPVKAAASSRRTTKLASNEPSLVGRKPVTEKPSPDGTAWDDPPEFQAAFALHMRRHRDSTLDLWRALRAAGEDLEVSTIVAWRGGRKAPRSAASLRQLRRIERRYGLPDGYFKAKLPHPARATTGPLLPGLSLAEQRRLAWHLPDDFRERPDAEQEEILAWVQEVVISGSTEYRRYQANAQKVRYAIRFPKLQRMQGCSSSYASDDDPEAEHDPELAPGRLIAPPHLAREMASLVAFKTTVLTPRGYQRRGVWCAETAAQKVEHLGLLLGALSASPSGPVGGAGAPLASLGLGLLVFPAIWDWYVEWRARRRGFYTAWEVDMLRVTAALTGAQAGWIAQTPGLGERLVSIAGLVDEAEIAAAKADWSAACSTAHAHCLARAKEIERVARVHRDPFEPILSVLQADSPLAEYRRIADEIVRLMPDGSRYGRSRAEATRSVLMIRLGLHLGLRQRNLRELLICPRGRGHTPERRLEEMRRGELRWSERDAGWEVLIPAVAFKNSGSSFFGGRPFRLILPDLADLYSYIEDWVNSHRQALLGRAADPGTFFVKTVKASTADAAYDQNTFYEAWRLITQRYGVQNPYTGRGAIKGLLPHGPHNVRDVLATHILKQTGSYEQASYAIQDTPDMVAKHYGRFLPQDKAALAAQVLNKVWAA